MKNVLFLSATPAEAPRAAWDLGNHMPTCRALECAKTRERCSHLRNLHAGRYENDI